MSTVVDAVGDDESTDRDPFDDDAIEVDEETLRQASPAAWMGRLTARLDDAARRVIYGR